MSVAQLFLQRVEKLGLLDDKVLNQLRKQVADAKGPIAAETLAKVLVDNGHLTVFQAKKIVAEVNTFVEVARSLAPKTTPPAASQVPAAEDESGLELIDDAPPAPTPVARPAPATPTATNPDGLELIDDDEGLELLDDAPVAPVSKAPATPPAATPPAPAKLPEPELELLDDAALELLPDAPAAPVPVPTPVPKSPTPKPVTPPAAKTPAPAKAAAPAETKTPGKTSPASTPAPSKTVASPKSPTPASAPAPAPAPTPAPATTPAKKTAPATPAPKTPASSAPAAPLVDGLTLLGEGDLQVLDDGLTPIDDSGFDPLTGSLATTAPKPAAAATGKAKPPGNPWDSALIYVGGGAVLVLMLAAVVLYYTLAAGSANKAFQLAEDDYKAGRYAVANEKYQAYLSRWDPLESTCRHASLSIL